MQIGGWVQNFCHCKDFKFLKLLQFIRNNYDPGFREKCVLSENSIILLQLQNKNKIDQNYLLIGSKCFKFHRKILQSMDNILSKLTKI